MPRKIGLGDVHYEQDIDGDIDFDFFDDGDGRDDESDVDDPFEERKPTSRSPPPPHPPDAADAAAGRDNAADTVSGSTEPQVDSNRIINDAIESLVSLDLMVKKSGDDGNGDVVVVSNTLEIDKALSRDHYYDDDDDDDGGPGEECGCGDVGSRTVLSTGKDSSRETVFKQESSSEVSLDLRSKEQAFADDYSEEFEDEDSNNSLDVSVSDTDSDSNSSISQDSLEFYCSDSEITDVTPLSSANISPLTVSPKRFLYVKQPSRFAELSKAKDGVKFLENGRLACANDGLNPPDSSMELKHLLNVILDMENEQQRKLLHVRGSELPRPVSSRSRKNMSFSNDVAQKIDRDNNILLKKILSHHRVRAPVNRQTKHSVRVASSAINREQQQKKIDAENSKLLKRIQSAKPTRELSRSYLLKPKDQHLSSSSLSNSQSSSRLSTRKLPSDYSASSSKGSSRSQSASSCSAQTCNGQTHSCIPQARSPTKTRSKLNGKLQAPLHNRVEECRRWNP